MHLMQFLWIKLVFNGVSVMCVIVSMGEKKIYNKNKINENTCIEERNRKVCNY